MLKISTSVQAFESEQDTVPMSLHTDFRDVNHRTSLTKKWSPKYRSQSSILDLGFSLLMNLDMPSVLWISHS